MSEIMSVATEKFAAIIEKQLARVERMKADKEFISISPDEITRLNDGYRRGEQARTNYYWASDFRNAFFGRLGFGELLERINHDISRYLELSDGDKKEFYQFSIQNGGADISQRIDKMLSEIGKARPRQIELRDVCQEHLIKNTRTGNYTKDLAGRNYKGKSEGLQDLKVYIEDQIFKFGAYADDSEKLKGVTDFVDSFVAFWKDNSSLLEKEDIRNYEQYQLNYQAFKETELYRDFTK